MLWKSVTFCPKTSVYRWNSQCPNKRLPYVSTPPSTFCCSPNLSRPLLLVLILTDWVSWKKSIRVWLSFFEFLNSFLKRNDSLSLSLLSNLCCSFVLCRKLWRAIAFCIRNDFVLAVLGFQFHPILFFQVQFKLSGLVGQEQSQETLYPIRTLQKSLYEEKEIQRVVTFEFSHPELCTWRLNYPTITTCVRPCYAFTMSNLYRGWFTWSRFLKILHLKAPCVFSRLRYFVRYLLRIDIRHLETSIDFFPGHGS